jgi:hypothetical protein
MKNPDEMSTLEVVLEFAMWIILAVVALLLAAIPKK